MKVASFLLLAAWAAGSLAAQKPPAEPKTQLELEQEKVAQTRVIPKEPPTVVTADPRRLMFHVSPLSARGLLSRQTRDALQALFRMTRDMTIVKLRAFVAGSGDMRRVQSLVSEVFTERRLPLPALTVVQVGALPLTGAQVVLESVAAARKDVNPHGLAFISGQAATSEDYRLTLAPLAEKSLADLMRAVRGAGADAKDVLRVTCFLTSLEDIDVLRARVARELPHAAANYVQIQRAPARSLVECEAVARLNAPVGAPLRTLNPDGLPASPHYSHVALVGAPKIVLTGAQMAFQYEEQDVRLAFQRLDRELAQVGASLRQTAMASIYPLSGGLSALIRKVRAEFYDMTRPPASTMLPFEGLPALDASLAVDVIAVPDASK
ncbi:MAG: RidA family protein [Bryobacterales bacterium]|nr:Rid family hydrolase [Bryobacteraceae bacterium]MDW8354269.1 RidA family protein [Bryobacterales bacterium]